VVGYALAPDTKPSLFERCELAAQCQHVEADVRDAAACARCWRRRSPTTCCTSPRRRSCGAATPSRSVRLDTNVMGTANVLEAVRLEGRPCAVVVVTSDKCYENREWVHGYREDDPMGGHDVYSMSKGGRRARHPSSWRPQLLPAGEARASTASRLATV